MGANLSKPSQSNPSPTATATSSPIMTASNSPKSETLIEEILDPPTTTRSIEAEEKPGESEDLIKEGDGDKEGEEEAGECGFCLFMKAGGCKDTFTEWEKCIEEGEKNEEDIVEKCFQATSALKKCMEAHTDYYGPILLAEKASEEEALKQLEEEKDRGNNHERGEALDASEKK